MSGVLEPRRGGLRALRGCALAVATGSLAVTAHGVGGGSWPGGGLAVLLVLAVAAAGTALAGRRRGPGAVLPAVGATQLALHGLLDALGGHAGHSATTGTAINPAAVDPAAMTAAHAVAALLTAGLLAGAESALFTLAGALRAIAVALAPVLPARPAHLVGVVPATSDRPLPVRVPLHRVAPRRGPPLPS